MSSSEKILVIKNNHSNKIKIKGSSFLGFAIKCKTQEDVNNNLTEMRKKYYDATHHCYAYKLETGEEKYSDDGEPSGTAGIRILNSINHFSLTDLLIVVVRYFGGTKLGVGPLGKAYGETSLKLLKETDIIELTKFQRIILSFPYDETSTIHYLINKFNCQKIKNEFNQSPLIACLVEPHLLNSIQEELIEKTSGKAIIKTTTEFEYIILKTK